MAEGEVGGAGAAEIVDTGGAGGEGGGGAQAPEWLAGMADLPDELRSDPLLSRYKTPAEQLRAHVEAHKVAKSKLALPGEGASDEDWGKVWTALGRPEAPDGYGDFGLEALPDTADEAAKAERATMLGSYQAELHKLGVPARLAGAIVKADLARIDAAREAYYAKGAEEVEALKAELKGKGVDYETEKKAARATFLKIFGEEAGPLADELDAKVGSGLLVRGMMKLAKLTGEHGKVDGEEAPGFAGGGNPNAELDTLMKDSGWRAKYLAGDAATKAQYEKLRAAAQQQALKQRA